MKKQIYNRCANCGAVGNWFMKFKPSGIVICKMCILTRAVKPSPRKTKAKKK